MEMLCYQCEQTALGSGCVKSGVCGKKPEVAAVQDLLVHACAGLALVVTKAGITDKRVADVVDRSLFATLTNVNFDNEPLAALIREVVALRDELAAKANIDVAALPAAARFTPAATIEALIAQGEEHGLKGYAATDADAMSLCHTALFGIKGIAAYAFHARVLGYEDPKVTEACLDVLANLYVPLGLGEWLEKSMNVGRANLACMELLDKANTETYGHPEPTEVALGAKKGPAILVSGHDLKDLYDILEQTKGLGINVYTHGEMLPTHAYPKLKAYPQLAGHYGTAWQNQHKEFEAFPGPIVMTTNCLMPPKDSYKDRVYNLGVVGFPGIKHLTNHKYDAVIADAKAMAGFPSDTDKGSVLTGFARNTVMSVAGKVIDAVKAGKIKRFFLVAGCDGAKPGRNYYTEFVEKLPADTIVLTLACGKFRFFDKKLGDIDGIPRLLDVGQCNDAYSAIQIALALADAFKCGVNDLPLSLILSWYEQKAVAILLTLLALGLKDIRLGPTLPAFVTPNVLKYLVDNFGIKPVTTPDADIKAILG